jgi:hypothetical protein
MLAAVLVSALAAQAAARPGATAVPCPVTAAELSGIVGKTLQRVNLGDPGAERGAQCSFSAVAKAGRFVSPQVYLTVERGGAADLRELYYYYLQARGKLATRPRVVLRPDLGPGAFTLTATTVPVSSAFFLAGKSGVGTLSVDLTDAGAGKRDQATAEKVFELVIDRLT